MKMMKKLTIALKQRLRIRRTVWGSSSPWRRRLKWSWHLPASSPRTGGRRRAASPWAALLSREALVTGLERRSLPDSHLQGREQRWAEHHNERPGKKKGCQPVKTQDLGVSPWTSQKTATKSKSRRHPTLPGTQVSNLSWPGFHQPPLQVGFGWKEAGKYPKASWGASSIPVGGVGKVFSTTSEDRHAYDWAASLLQTRSHEEGCWQQLWQNSIPIYDKNSPESRHRRNLPHHDQGIANILLNGEKLKVFKIRYRTRRHCRHYYSTAFWKS